MWEGAPCIRPECHEPCNEFRVDPVGLGACAPADGEGFDLGWRQLPRQDPGSVKGGPQTPYTAPSATSAKAAGGGKLADWRNRRGQFCLGGTRREGCEWRGVTGHGASTRRSSTAAGAGFQDPGRDFPGSRRWFGPRVGVRWRSSRPFHKGAATPGRNCGLSTSISRRSRSISSAVAALMTGRNSSRKPRSTVWRGGSRTDGTNATVPSSATFSAYLQSIAARRTVVRWDQCESGPLRAATFTDFTCFGPKSSAHLAPLVNRQFSTTGTAPT